VTKAALANAASVAGLVLSTESAIVDKPAEPEHEAHSHNGHSHSH
jgi:chaperonin GroEL